MAIITSKANLHEAKLFLKTLNEAKIRLGKNLSLLMDRGYAGLAIAEVPPKRVRSGIIEAIGGDNAWRWKVEPTLAYMNKWKGLAVRMDRKCDTYEAMLCLWAAWM